MDQIFSNTFQYIFFENQDHAEEPVPLIGFIKKKL